WMLYFAEQYGMDFWVDVWDQFRNNRTLPFLDAVEFSLLNRNKALQVEHLINHLWHMSAGPLNSSPDFGFEERFQYPESAFSNTLQFIPDSLSGNNLQALAANYSTVEVVSSAPGQPEFMLNSSVNGVGLGLVGYFRDGSTLEEFTIDPSSSTQTIQTTWNWSDLQDIKIAVVNTNRSTSANYDLTVSSKIPDRDLISQNYPNPFNPTTRIEFSVNSQKNVRIDVFDSIGRRIQTLVNRPFTRGFHFVEFDGDGLSSGIYYYRIVTGQTSQTKKMILIK
ncbi:MAG: T9SS type A sorting domain-containing protein, partial [Balneolaceae bacterium]